MSGGREGLLLVDKPEGPTSHDIVARARRILGQPRIGHAGTLDPMASGLLPLVLGRATRLVRFLPHSPKVYAGRFVLGMSTSTDDIEGVVIARHEGTLPPDAEVRAAAAELLGRQSQVPPRVAARKVGGERMYRLARRGEAFEAPPAEVEVFRFTLSSSGDPGSWDFEAAVSGGTYIRALVRDLGGRIGCGATLARLRRTAIGPLEITAATPLPGSHDAAARDELCRRVLPLEALPLAPPEIRLADAVAADRFVAGVACLPPATALAEGNVRVLDPDGRLLGIGELADGRLRPRVVLPRP